MTKLFQLIFYFSILLLAFSITLLAFLWLGDGLCNLKYLIKISDSSVISEGVEEVSISDNTSASPDSNGAIQVLNAEMLNYVIQCESSGNMDAIGKQGEIGILQWKTQSWDYFSKRYNFTGSIYNRQDQKDLFLMTTDAEKEQHWTCMKKYLKQLKK